MKIVTTLMLIAFAASAAAEKTTPPVKGVLCFKECRAVVGQTIETAPADVERTFVWSSADGKQLVFGVLPAKSGRIDLADKALRDVTLSVRGDKRHGWPADLRIRVADANKKEWKSTVPAKSVESLARLRVPNTKLTIDFSADHHLSASRQIDPAKTPNLREVTLRPMPVITGHVVTMKEQPIANARIVRADRKLIAETDDQGGFRGEVGEPVPDAVLVEKSGFGSRVVHLDVAGGDKDLGALQLGTGVKLSLLIGRPEGNQEPLKIELQRKNEQKYEFTPIASKDLGGTETNLAFDDLSSGDYAVIVSGKTPVEKFATDIAVKDADLRKEIKIEPFRLDGTATLGEDPIDGELTIPMSRFHTSVTLPIENGRFSATLWQHGKVSGFVRPKDMSTYEVVTSPLLGDDPSEWNIRFPKRLITGRVYDAETRQAVEGAKMDLLRSSGDSRWFGTMRLQNDGSYSILANRTGTYELTVTAPDHVDMKQAIEVKDGDGSTARDFALSRGLVATLELVWPSGAPVVDAAVLDGVGSDGYQAERQYATDASGRLSLRLQQGESRTLYIVPKEGSLAVAHVAAQEGGDANPIRMTVPEPAGSLRIAIATTDGKPINAGVGMRFNGEPIPAPVLYEIGFRTTPDRLDDRSLLQLPAGAYELWPVATQGWAVSTKTRAPIGPSKSVSVSAGVVSVDLVASASR